MVYTLRFFFSLKCSLFHNSNLFGFCIIHTRILYTKCAKIKKNNSGAKRLKVDNELYTIYIPIIKANEMHYFSYLFDKVLYMFQTSPLSIISSITTLFTRNRYLSC
jgi:hypothetical protein